MKRILVAGASTYGVKNMGDDAMLYNLTHNLHKKIKSQITFLARHPSPDYDKLFNVHSIKNYEFDSKKLSEGKYFFGFNPGDSNSHLLKIKDSIARSDLIVIGGNSFMEVSETTFMRGVCFYSALLAIFAKFFGKPYVLYGVAGHKLRREITKQIARFLCLNANVVTVREKFFKNALIDAGVRSKNIKVCGDPAWGVDRIKNMNIGKTILNNENIRFRSKRVVGIGFRHMYWMWGEKDFSKYSQKMAKLCDYIVDRLQADLLFIPNCTYNLAVPFHDDRIVAKQVMARMKNRKNAYSIKGEMNLNETLSLYSHIDMLVANRRHSCIFAAINGKPMLAMSTGHHWQFKPFMEDLGLSEYAASFTKSNLSSLKTKINSVWENKESIQFSLSKFVPRLRKKAHKQIDLLIQAME
jgi:polysaccharide pyruvyl transferase WcaK-like protein